MLLDPSKPLGRLSRFLLSSVIVLGVVSTAGIATLNFYPGLALLPMAGNLKYSPYCTIWQGVGDVGVKLGQNETSENIRKQSRVIQTEGHFKLWSTSKGNFWVPDNNDRILGVLLAQQERNIYGDARTGGVRKNDIVLDGGAHIGTYVMAAIAAGAETIVAIEPSPDALWCLRKNFAKEIAAGKVIIYDKGIWDEEKSLVFFENGNGAAGDGFVTEGKGARKITVPVTTIDKIVAELNLPRVDIIKADIKGAGTRMIHGGQETIRKYHPRMVISVEEKPEDPAAIRQAVLNINGKYQFHSGPCMFSDGELRNDTIFFQ